MINYKNRLTWHKNSLIERSGYVFFYMNSLKNHLPVNDRQTLYIIAKYFTDAVEFAKINISACDYFFQTGEYYHRQIPKENFLLNKLIFNSYDRATSYYYFKIKEYDKATERINHTLEINASIKEIFPVLIFDSISHYQNLLKVLMFQKKKEDANTLIYEIVKFLLTGKTELKALKNCYNTANGPDFKDFKQFFLNEFIFNYMILNPDFSEALNKLITLYKDQKELVLENAPVASFLNLYLSDEEYGLDSFKEKYGTYFNGIPMKIIREKFVI
jgi:hypothetical protein